MKKYTKYRDENGEKIYVGDLLQNEHEYHVIVVEDKNGHFSGKLVCHDKHSCKNIGYALNKGKGHLKVNKKSLVFQYEGKTCNNDFTLEKDKLVVRDDDCEAAVIFNFQEFNCKIYVKGVLTICKLYLN